MGYLVAFHIQSYLLMSGKKQALAYYAASGLESHKGLMMVMSGIDLKNYEGSRNNS